MVATWIGHATMLVQTQGMNILTDPVYAERAGPFGWGPQRVTRPGVAFDDLPPIDLVLLSHNHYDKSGGLFEVTVTRNHHWGSRWFSDRNRALWSSFVVRLPGGNLFFAGDTGWGDGRWPAEAAKLGPIRLALIPIGAFRFVPGQMSSGAHLGPAQAADVFHALGASTAIPIHWGTFRLSYEARDTPPRMLEAAMRCGGLPGNFTAVEIGRPVAIPARPAAPPTGSVPRPRTGAELLRCLDTPEVRALR